MGGSPRYAGAIQRDTRAGAVGVPGIIPGVRIAVVAGRAGQRCSVGRVLAVHRRVGIDGHLVVLGLAVRIVGTRFHALPGLTPGVQAAHTHAGGAGHSSRRHGEGEVDGLEACAAVGFTQLLVRLEQFVLIEVDPRGHALRCPRSSGHREHVLAVLREVRVGRTEIVVVARAGRTTRSGVVDGTELHAIDEVAVRGAVRRVGGSAVDAVVAIAHSEIRGDVHARSDVRRVVLIAESIEIDHDVLEIHHPDVGLGEVEVGHAQTGVGRNEQLHAVVIAVDRVAEGLHHATFGIRGGLELQVVGAVHVAVIAHIEREDRLRAQGHLVQHQARLVHGADPELGLVELITALILAARGRSRGIQFEHVGTVDLVLAHLHRIVIRAIVVLQVIGHGVRGGIGGALPAAILIAHGQAATTGNAGAADEHTELIAQPGLQGHAVFDGLRLLGRGGQRVGLAVTAAVEGADHVHGGIRLDGVVHGQGLVPHAALLHRIVVLRRAGRERADGVVQVGDHRAADVALRVVVAREDVNGGHGQVCVLGDGPTGRSVHDLGHTIGVSDGAADEDVLRRPVRRGGEIRSRFQTGQVFAARGFGAAGGEVHT